MDGLAPAIQWAASIASTLIITACTAAINKWMTENKKDREREEVDRKEWRKGVDKALEELNDKLADVDNKVDRSIASQAAQLRSDIVHKCHRYLDDLGRASIEEKQALADEHKQYSKFCEDLDLENNFIDEMVARVMALPEREI